MNHQILEQGNILEPESSQGRFYCIFPYYFPMSCFSHVVKYTIEWKSGGRKVPIIWGKYGYQFPRLCQFDGFCCIFLCYGKLMGKPCIFQVMKYTIGWKSNGKKVSILWKNHEHQNLRRSLYDGFCWIFSC